ncbi:hypothetical protein [Magnetofaba australis]|uniref:Uncharacterized protein n=1 Tax=Magnetofaba australis IT-1 TaxID=1434232 RepID=A0A1Y2K5X4_9PROT|nr:hypothetical protein [Magnetofaba australis]OSM05081.1 hypothetical protein MAIT1_03222 [Magnetofaba australis IT-1]
MHGYKQLAIFSPTTIACLEHAMRFRVSLHDGFQRVDVTVDEAALPRVMDMFGSAAEGSARRVLDVTPEEICLPQTQDFGLSGPSATSSSAQ